MRTASLAAVTLVLSHTGAAVAEGERSPMFGIAVLGADVPDHDAEMVGAHGEIAWWVLGRLAIAGESSARWSVIEGGPRALTLGGSARVLLLDGLVTSWLERRDVEFGLEIQGFGERTWWGPDDASTGYGIGVALRLRGSGDDEFSRLIAESRLFVRVSTTRDSTFAPMATKGSVVDTREGPTVLVGLGAAFGTGDRRYLDRFRLRPFDLFDR
jgi:hypothetical protein